MRFKISSACSQWSNKMSDCHNRWNTFCANELLGCWTAGLLDCWIAQPLQDWWLARCEFRKWSDANNGLKSNWWFPFFWLWFPCPLITFPRFRFKSTKILLFHPFPFTSTWLNRGYAIVFRTMHLHIVPWLLLKISNLIIDRKQKLKCNTSIRMKKHGTNCVIQIV
jgi:hypothetical protein